LIIQLHTIIYMYIYISFPFEQIHNLTSINLVICDMDNDKWWKLRVV